MAVATGSLEELYNVADDLPCADFGLLGPLKRSPEYADIRKRVADPKPIDAWQAGTLHYFVFLLRPREEDPPEVSGSFVLFTMRWEDDDPVAAVVIMPSLDANEAKVIDIRKPEKTHIIKLSRE